MNYDILIAFRGSFITASKCKLNNLLYMATIKKANSPSDAAWKWYNGVIELPDHESGTLTFKSVITGEPCRPGAVVHNYDWLPLSNLLNPFIFVLPTPKNVVIDVPLEKIDPNWVQKASKRVWHLYCFLDGYFMTTIGMNLSTSNSLGLTVGDTPEEALKNWYTRPVKFPKPIKSILRDKEVQNDTKNYDWFPYKDLLGHTFSLVETTAKKLIPVPVSILVSLAKKINGIPVYEKLEKVKGKPVFKKEFDPKTMFKEE